MGMPVCELCHGTSFIKEDGMFVCQGCGTKYTPEEAQSLMMPDANTNRIHKSPVKEPAPAPAAAHAANAIPKDKSSVRKQGKDAIVVLADGTIASPDTAMAFAPAQLSVDMGVRGVNNYVCQGWQLTLDEFNKIEHPTKEQHEALITTAKECLVVMDNAAMADPAQYVYNAIIYRNCKEIVASACAAEYHTQGEDGTWKKDRIKFASDLNLPGQKDSWESKYEAQRARIVEEFENTHPDNVAQRAELAAQETEISEALHELKDEKRSKGLFNFSEKREVKERMAPVKEELSQVRSQIHTLEREIDSYIDERLNEHAQSYVMLDF